MTNKFTATRKGFNIIIVLVCGTEDAGLGDDLLTLVVKRAAWAYHLTILMRLFTRKRGVSGYGV